MPNYPTHARWGRIGAVAAALLVGGAVFYVFETVLLATGSAVGAAGATFVGAIFPDIDHHKSIPRRKANRALQALVVLGVVSLVALNFEVLVSAIETTSADFDTDLPVPPEVVVAVAGTVVAFVCAGLVDPLIGVATRSHRAWTHSVAVTFVLTALIAGSVWVGTSDLAIEQQVAAVAVVWTFFLGILVHLGLDGEIL
jgi:uncharacterized protein YacL